MFQDPTLYPWRTVRANVSLGLEARGLLRTHGSRVDEALRLVGLTGFEDRLSSGEAARASMAEPLIPILSGRLSHEGQLCGYSSFQPNPAKMMPAAPKYKTNS